MAAKFLVLAFVAILSTQALVEGHEHGKDKKDKGTDILKKILGELENTKLRECVKAESQSFIDLYTSTVDDATKCAQKSDIQETLKKLQTQYNTASDLVKSICTDIKGCNANQECIINVVKTQGPELGKLMKKAVKTIKKGKSAIQEEEKECFKGVRKSADEKLKKICATVKECNAATTA